MKLPINLMPFDYKNIKKLFIYLHSAIPFRTNCLILIIALDFHSFLQDFY